MIAVVRRALAGFLGGCAILALRWPKTIVLAALVLTVICAGYAVTHVAVNTDTTDLIDPNLPFRKTLARLDAQFPHRVDGLLVVIDAPTPEQATQARDRMAALLDANDRFAYVFKPGGGDFFRRHGLLYLSVDELETVTAQLADAQPVLAALAADPSLRGLVDLLSDGVDDAVKDGAASDGLLRFLAEMAAVTQRVTADDDTPMSWRRFLADDVETFAENRLFVQANPKQDFTRLQPAKAALDEARALGRQVEAAMPGVRVGFTGSIALNAEEMESVSTGASVAGLLSFLFVSLVLGLGLRSLRLTLAAVALLLMGLIWTAAFALAAVGSFNLVSVAFAVLFIGLGVDFAIHFGLRYQEEIDQGAAHAPAVAHTVEHVGIALSLAAPTTALAFYAFVPTAYKGLSELGLISGTGILISYFSSLIVLPALLSLMPLRQRPGRHRGQWPRRHAGFVARHAGAILFTTALASLAALVALPQLRFDFDPLRLKDPAAPSVRLVEDLLANSTNSPYAAELVVPGAAAASEAEARLEPLASVDKVVHLARFVPEKQPQKLDLLADTALFMTPALMPASPLPSPSVDEQAAAMADFRDRLQAMANAPTLAPPAPAQAQRLLAALADYERRQSGAAQPWALLERVLIANVPVLLADLADALAASPVTLADLPADLAARYVGKDGGWRLEVFPAGDMTQVPALQRFVGEVTALFPTASGHPVQLVMAGDVVVGSMIQATATAALAISLLLLMVLRGVRQSLLVLVPVIVAGLLSAAATVWFNISINFASIIVLPLIIGLGVDSAIHLTTRARRGGEAGSDAMLGNSTPRAVLLSALTTIGSFASLAISAHQGTASMGVLLTVSIALTLIVTLLSLPALVEWLARKRPAAPPNR